ncbi:MAG: formate dehydrogenase subunit alpha [Dehalococcoidia bacterium]
MNFITLTIDDREVKAPVGSSVLRAAEDSGIYIPTLCYHESLEPYGGCRMCIVDIENMRGLPPACTTPAGDGMVVRTSTPQLTELRRGIMELILSEHPHSCLVCWRKERCKPFDICLRNVDVTARCVNCPKNRRCELQTVFDYLGMAGCKEISLPYKYRDLPMSLEDPFIDRDNNLCILCGRCVRVCQEVRVNGCLSFTYRGSEALVGTAFGRNYKESGSEFCGACVDICPVGAIMERRNKWAGLPERLVKTTCPYCGVGCQLLLEVKDGEVLRITPDLEGAANLGQACVKGRFGVAETINHPERLTTPLVRKNGKLEEATWDEALDLVVSKLAGYKPQELAVITSAKCTNEDNYVMQKFSRAVLGTNNVDHCARLCHAPTVAGLVQSFGSGAMSNSISEIADAECILAIGTNTTFSHPVIGIKVKQAARQGKKLIVANPREIELCRYADIWLRQMPGSDVALLMGMMRVIVDEGLEDKEFIAARCEDYDVFLESLRAFTPEFVAEKTGVPWEKVQAAARMYAQNSPATLLYAMGITQHTHGTDNVLATANLAMLTGNMGKPSTGVNPLRGHNNVQGACDMGALPNVYPGYQSVADAASKQKFENAWGKEMQAKPGLTLTEMFDAVYTDEIKAIYLVGENPARSEPCLNHCSGAMERLDFLVVQDLVLTETARLAHVVLPACSFAEEDGTFTNTERRVQRVRRAVEPVGDSRPDWWITCQIASRMGAQGFDFEDPSQIMDEIARVTPSYGGISYSRLEGGGLQWPCPTPDHPGTPILHTQNFTRGKGRFLPLEYRPPDETPDEEYPLILTTERTLWHFHTGTMTRKVPGLNELRNEELVEMHPADAQKLGIEDGEMVKVTSRRGEVEARLLVTEVSPPGVVSMTFHFTEAPTNVLTNPKVDPVSKIPEYKVCAIRVEKIKVRVGA